MSALILSAFFGLNLALQIEDGNGSRLQTYPIEKLFIPTGFDDNDEIQVIASGSFRDRGWEPVSLEHERVKDGFKLKLIVRKWDGPSASVITPFKKETSLGALRKGDYKFYDENDRDLGTLSIHAAHSQSRDDYLYAPVDSLKVRYEFDPETRALKRRILVLQGYFPNACHQFVENPPVVPVAERSPNLIEVLPVVEDESDKGDPCATVITDFEHEIEIPNSIGGGRFLVHVRTNGNPYNKLIHLLSMK